MLGIRGPLFVSAVQPTGQGEESVVLLVVVGAVFELPVYSFLDVFVTKWVSKGKNFVSK